MRRIDDASTFIQTSRVDMTGWHVTPGWPRRQSTPVVVPRSAQTMRRRSRADPYDAAMTVPDLFRLDGRVAVVTGASSGLGVAFAQGLAEAGADVALGARRADRLKDTAALVETAGRRALTIATDVADPDSCTNLVALAMEEFGRVDILVNNAGIGTAV